MHGPDKLDGPPPHHARNRMRPDNAKRRLNGLVRDLSRLESGAAPLRKAQAQRVVSLLRPWQNRPHMTQTQAKTLHSSLTAILTTQQKRALTTLRQQQRNNRRERDGGRGDGFRGPGRGPRGEGGPPRRDEGGPPRRNGRDFDPQTMRAQMQKMRGFGETMNPFYAPSRYAEVKNLPPRMQQRLMRRHRETQDALNALTRQAARRR